MCSTLPTPSTARPVNNDIYEQLGARWYEANDDPVALLRAEARLRNPWVARHVEGHLGTASHSILDIGCGGGFLSNELAKQGHQVTGLDASYEALEVARSYDATARARYRQGDAESLPFGDASFDVVCAMDLLEHVERPSLVVSEAARVLRPGGLFFFHTFNRNWLSWLIVIKGVEWVVRNTPPDMHVLRLFLKPGEVRAMCAQGGLAVAEIRGSAPRVFSRAFGQLLLRGTVSKELEFRFTRSTLLGYTGYATRLR